ncbi:hypothetical protein GCM10010245_70390 [Streptomyces spectabilis]|nr:hypothetical protein GCM10010245_70390 [Streptomyces spectabilis]
MPGQVRAGGWERAGRRDPGPGGNRGGVERVFQGAAHRNPYKIEASPVRIPAPPEILAPEHHFPPKAQGPGIRGRCHAQ